MSGFGVVLDELRQAALAMSRGDATSATPVWPTDGGLVGSQSSSVVTEVRTRVAAAVTTAEDEVTSLGLGLSSTESDYDGAESDVSGTFTRFDRAV